MSQKFNRNYILTIDPKDGEPVIVVQPPFTIRFHMKRDIVASLNNISIDIYNLSLSNRRRIYQDTFNLQEKYINGVNVGRSSVSLQIGYGSTLYQVYSGDIFLASSVREGTDLITHIEGLSGAFDVASGNINTTLVAGTTLAQVFKALIAALPNVQYGCVGNWNMVFPRAIVLNGNAWQLIQQYSGNRGYIDNGKAYVLQDNEALIATSLTTLDASSGLLETPRREFAFMTVTTLLEAGVTINQILNINSAVEPVYNGSYKVVGFQHAGVISGAVSGDCRTTFFLLAANYFNYTKLQGS